MKYVELIEKLAQIAFWAVAASVAVVTYRQARRTVLQPIRTEIFKSQLTAMSQIFGLFLGKHELELRAEFDFRALFDANLWKLIDAYASNFFGLEFDAANRPYNSHDCPIREGISPGTQPSTSYTLAEQGRPDTPSDDPRAQLARWNEYKTDYLCINRKFWDAEKNFTVLLENPLLPLELVNLLTKYRRTAAQNRTVLLNILDATAKELPEKYGSREELEQMSPDWVWHRYMQDFNHLKPIADQIVDYIRGYFDPDNLTKSEPLAAQQLGPGRQ